MQSGQSFAQFLQLLSHLMPIGMMYGKSAKNEVAARVDRSPRVPALIHIDQMHPSPIARSPYSRNVGNASGEGGVFSGSGLTWLLHLNLNARA